MYHKEKASTWTTLEHFLLKPLGSFEFQGSPCSYCSNSEIDYDITPNGLKDSKQLY